MICGLNLDPQRMQSFLKLADAGFIDQQRGWTQSRVDELASFQPLLQAVRDDGMRHRENKLPAQLRRRKLGPCQKQVHGGRHGLSATLTIPDVEISSVVPF